MAMGIVAQLQADTITETYDEGAGEWWNVRPDSKSNRPAIQWFSIPDGEVGIEFEMLLEKGKNTNSDHIAVVQVYAVDHTLVGQATLSAADFGKSSAWLKVTALNEVPMALESGEYYAVAFTNQLGYNTLHAELRSGSAYEEGYAATGFKGGVPLGPEQDFTARFTVVPLP